AAEIDELVDKKFDGSLPAFVAAFTKHRKLSEKEIDAVQQMIDRYRVLNRDDNTGDEKDKKEKHMDSEGGHR
ncbi:MAG: BlaI/MecI/CopY family transcriptional regulator, partial [Lachnospiraceae bacterium]|nr:BlaI/MecI/CopY family transcriptional regulator [Lachnospiraceae bacterium]